MCIITHDRSEFTLQRVFHASSGTTRSLNFAPQDVARPGAMIMDSTSADNALELGRTLENQGNFHAAAEVYRTALQSFPNRRDLHFKYGNALAAQGMTSESIPCYRAVLRLDPVAVPALNNLGNSLSLEGNLDEAIACFQKSLALSPNSVAAHNGLGNALKNAGRIADAAEAFRRALALAPNMAGIHSNLAYTMLFDPQADPTAIREELRTWNRLHCKPLTPQRKPHLNTHAPNRRLCIGYVSPDFRDHCQSYFTLPLLAHHNRKHFEIFCYADISKPDAVTEKLRPHADGWHDTANRSDEELADLIHTDRIDILVDLTMHMMGNRLLTFARKPAPLQVSWLAYPGNTGLDAIDYRLSDPHLDPYPSPERLYAESTLRLPDSFWCYDPPAIAPAIAALPAATAGHITFGCLNNFAKVNDAVLRLWAQALNRVNGSHLLLLAPQGSARQHVLAIFQHEGIRADRIEFIGRMPAADYFATYHRIDISLDTIPYNGHTTSLDSLWMGVPVVTLVGDRVVGRGGLSLLMNLGLPELIAHTPQQFAGIAAALAADLPRLAELRSSMRNHMQTSPLMDAPRFARAMENLYRQMWQKWCAGENPPISPVTPPA